MLAPIVEGNFRGASEISPLSYSLLLLVTLINIGYNIYLYFKYGETIGYRLFGMKIISKNTGGKPSTGSLLGRYFVKFILTAIPFINFVGILIMAGMIAWTKKKQGPHDKVAKTYVVVKEWKNTWLVWLTNIIFLIIPVIIVILGVLSGLLFNFLDPSAQASKARDAQTKSILTQMVTQGAMYYVTNQGYNGFCEGLISQDYICSDSNDGFMAAAKLDGGKYFCVDSYGHGGEYDSIDKKNNSCE